MAHSQEGPWTFAELIDWAQLDSNHRHYLKVVARDDKDRVIYGCFCGYTKTTTWPNEHPEVVTVAL